MLFVFMLNCFLFFLDKENQNQPYETDMPHIEDCRPKGGNYRSFTSFGFTWHKNIFQTNCQ